MKKLTTILLICAAFSLFECSDNAQTPSDVAVNYDFTNLENFNASLEEQAAREGIGERQMNSWFLKIFCDPDFMKIQKKFIEDKDAPAYEKACLEYYKKLLDGKNLSTVIKETK